jgi:signal transduction histidine kinase
VKNSVNKRRYWLWVTLFVGVALILGTLALGWNVVLVRDYRHMVDLAHTLANSKDNTPALPVSPLITSIVLGMLGFFAVLGIQIVFFIRLLQEMKANQQQSEFLATVTHELKTPIAAIELSSSLLREGSLTHEETEKLWSSHQAELARLRSEVESLLEAARWESMSKSARKQSLSSDAQKVNLEMWLRESMERWRSILGPNAELLREGEILNGPAVLDLKKLNLISDNIFENSRKYANGNPKVIIRTSLKKNRWQIQFQDFGWGFDPKDSKKILKPFFRARSHAPYAVPGAGLGLYIASSASHSLGMKMRGSSSGHGKGSSFTLEGKSQRYLSP